MLGAGLWRRVAATGTVIAAPVRVTGEMAGSLVALLPGAADQYGEHVQRRCRPGESATGPAR